MHWLYSLRTRLIISYTALILIGFGILVLWAGQQIATAAEEDFARRAQSDVNIVANALEEPLEDFLEGDSSNQQIKAVLDQYATQLEADITLIYDDNQRIISGNTTRASNINLDTPEISAAQDNRTTYDIRAGNDGHNTVYTAASILHDNEILGIIQIGVSMKEVEEAVQERWYTMGGSIIVMAIITGLLSIIISASLTRPLNQLQQTTAAIGDGDLSLRADDSRRDEIGQMARTFNHMVKQVNNMLEEQKSFASNASHELRTPLTTIRLRSEALLHEELDEALRQRYIAEIDSEVKRIKDLVDDLILLAKLDADTSELRPGIVDLPRTARHLVNHMQEAAQAQQTKLSLQTLTDLPPVPLNISHLNIIFRNILDNAIKYMPESGGSIRWDITQQNGYIVSTITDDGKGIAPEDLSQVLKRFYRVDKARSREVNGSGLGLSLVQSIVQRYDGEMRIESAGIGHGTTVTIQLPVTDFESA